MKIFSECPIDDRYRKVWNTPNDNAAFSLSSRVEAVSGLQKSHIPSKGIESDAILWGIDQTGTNLWADDQQQEGK